MAARRRHAVGGKLPGALALALIGAGCGTSSQAPFAWVQPQPVPRHWAVVRIAPGSELAYPPGWRIVPGDQGTATAALLGEGGRYLGYLNVTPRQGDENLATWASFRIAHNADEGDTAVKLIAAATGLRFRAGHGSCVKDSYTTRTGARYIEVACLIEGPRAESVIVGAAPPDSWSRTSTTLERAISASQGVATTHSWSRDRTRSLSVSRSQSGATRWRLCMQIAEVRELVTCDVLDTIDRQRAAP